MNRVSIEELQKHTELDTDLENEFTVEEVRVCDKCFIFDFFLFFNSLFLVLIRLILLNLTKQYLNKYQIRIKNYHHQQRLKFMNSWM